MILVETGPTLHRLGREWYTLTIATTPAVTAWEASFDRGLTFKPGEVAGGGSVRWLVAGADADPTGADAVISEYTIPLIRAIDDPEVVVRIAPAIEYAN